MLHAPHPTLIVVYVSSKLSCQLPRSVPPTSPALTCQPSVASPRRRCTPMYDAMRSFLGSFRFHNHGQTISTPLAIRCCLVSWNRLECLDLHNSIHAVLEPLGRATHLVDPFRPLPYSPATSFFLPYRIHGSFRRTTGELIVTALPGLSLNKIRPEPLPSVLQTANSNLKTLR